MRNRNAESSRKRNRKRPSGSNGAARRPSSSAASSPLSTVAAGYRSLIKRFGWIAIGVTVAIVVLLAFLIVSGIRGCTASTEQQSTPSSSAATTTSASASSASSSNLTPVEAIVEAVPEVDKATIDEDAIVNILGDDLASQLLTQAKSNNDAHWIASHPDEYLEDGTIVRYKLLRLAAKEPQAIQFVRNWPEQYCASKPDYSADHTNDSSNGVPRLYQWDERWGYTEYSSTTFALTGCAPTSLAMVYQARTGDTSKSPYDMGVFANENGYATEYEGTDGSLFSVGGESLGLTCTELDVNSESLQQALANGQIVVVNVGPGDFTDGGHYLVATGIASDGNVVINDPFSAVRSNKTWGIDTIIDQTVALYAF